MQLYHATGLPCFLSQYSYIYYSPLESKSKAINKLYKKGVIQNLLNCLILLVNMFTYEHSIKITKNTQTTKRKTTKQKQLKLAATRKLHHPQIVHRLTKNYHCIVTQKQLAACFIVKQVNWLLHVPIIDHELF